MQKDRNYGIDLLRMVCMLFIAVAHVEGHGGVLEAAQGTAACWAYLPEIFCYACVNGYALISGYVGVGRRWRPANLIYLWMQVCFYSVGITALYGLLVPGSIGVSDLVRAAMPVTHQFVDYWYFTAYFGLFFLIPLLNFLAVHMPSRQLRALVLALMLVFSVFPTLLRQDRFYLNNGYSVWWLAILYLLGACLKRCGGLSRVRGRRALLLYAVASLLTYGLYMGSGYLAEHWPLYVQIGDRFFGAQARWLNFISPTVVLAAVGLLLFFADLRLPPRVVAAVRRLSPLAFGVYLIHNHPLVAQYWMDGRFSAFAQLPGPLMIAAIGAAALGIYLVCMLVDALRAWLFGLLRLRGLAEWLEEKLRMIFMRAFAWLS